MALDCGFVRAHIIPIYAIWMVFQQGPVPSLWPQVCGLNHFYERAVSFKSMHKPERKVDIVMYFGDEYALYH